MWTQSQVKPDNQKIQNFLHLLLNSYIVKTHDISSLLMSKKPTLFKSLRKLSVGYLRDFLST